MVLRIWIVLKVKKRNQSQVRITKPFNKMSYHYKNITQSGLISTTQGRFGGFIVNSHSSGTLALIDGTEGTAVAASSTLISAGASAPATHASATLTSTGNSVAATHAVTVFTKTGQFLDATKGTGYITSDQTQPTAGHVVILGAITYTWRALGGTTVNSATAVDVPLGNTALESWNNLYNALITHPLVDVVRTSAYVITVTAKTAGVAGNLTATENDSHTAWDDGATLTSGADAETITLGSKVYTWANTITSSASSTAIQVKIGSTLTISLANFRKAVNATGTSGLEYSFGLGVADPNVVCSASDGTTFTLRGRVPGSSLDTIATTETCATGSFPDTTLGGGTGASDPGVTTANATLTIGTVTYTQVDALSETYGATAIPNQILRGASEATFYDGIKLAINGTGVAGTDYSTGTVAHTQVVATTNTDTSQIIRGRLPGTSLNSVVTTETMANTAWGGTTLGGAGNTAGVTTAAAQFVIGTRTYTAVVELTETLVGVTGAVVDQVLWVTSEAVFLDNVKKVINLTGTAGTDYSTGTTINVDVVATTNSNTQQVVVAKTLGTVGNLIATTTNLANYSWTSTVLASGAGATGKLIMNTFTFPTGSSIQVLPDEGIQFDTALSAVVGGTSADITLMLGTK